MPMTLRLKRAGLLAAEGVGLTLAAAVVFFIAVLWRVQAGPVRLDWAAPAVRLVANASGFDGAVAAIGGVGLAKADGGYLLTVTDLRLGRKGAEATAVLPSVSAAIYPADLLSGRVGARRILIDGATLRVVRTKGRALKVRFDDAAGDRARVFEALTGGAYFREAFERAEIRGATVIFHDEASGRTWTGRDGRAEIRRDGPAYVASLASDFLFDRRNAHLSLAATYDPARELIEARLALRDAPVGDLVSLLFGAEAQLLTSPITGAFEIVADPKGRIAASRIALEAGAGELVFGRWSTPLHRLSAAATFDPRRNEFAIERVEWASGAGSGALAGAVSLTQARRGRGVEQVNFSLSGTGLSVHLPELFSDRVAIDRAGARGAYQPATRTLSFDAVSADFDGATLAGRLRIRDEQADLPALSGRLALQGVLDRRSVLNLWPYRLARSAREFVATRMMRGAFSDVEIAVDLEPEQVGADGGVPNEALTIQFRAAGAEVVYAPGMSPLREVSGRGLLQGNKFHFAADSARVDAVRLVKGEVDIPVLVPKGEPAYFRFNAVGDAGDMLAVLAQEPLAVLKSTHFSPEQFSGRVAAQVEIMRPNLREALRDDYRYHGVATFESLGVEGIFGDAALAAAKGKLTLQTDGMVIAGEGRVAEAPVSIEWRQKFFGDGDTTAILVRGEADSGAADLFGVPTRRFVQGAVPFTAKAVGGVDRIRSLELDADFTRASLVSESFGWMKPPGAAARGAARFAFSDSGVEIAGLTVEGEGLAISGAAFLGPGGALETLDVPTFRLDGAANLSIAANRAGPGALALTVTGRYVNAAEMIRSMIDGGMGDGRKTPLSLTARIDRIDMRGGATYRDAALEFRRSADRIEALDLSAIGEDRTPLAVELKDTGEGTAGEQSFEARADDIGALIAGVFGVTSVKGGRGHLDFTFTPGLADAPKTGALAASDLRIVKAPLLARIFAAGSLTGLADLLNGTGIELSNASARFTIKDGAIHVSEARATGPSVGITAEGALPLGEGGLDLSGAVAPAYQVNSLLGKTPVIGGLFVNREGEGLLALAYEVDGPPAEPRVTVNPLSALAPGVLRRMFEGGRSEAETEHTD
jgi:hypothetical protein